MIYNIYKITDKNGSCYIGQTTRKLSTRFSEHKYQKRLGIDWTSAKIELIEKTNTPDEREIFWISKISNLNKSIGGRGPNGCTHTEKNKKYFGYVSKKSWKQGKHKKTLEVLEKYRTKKFQKKSSWLSNLTKWSKMPKYIAIKKDTGEIFGPYQGYYYSSRELNYHSDCILNCLKHGANSRRFYFEYLKE